jgi:hypothetical protein
MAPQVCGPSNTGAASQWCKIPAMPSIQVCRVAPPITSKLIIVSRFQKLAHYWFVSQMIRLKKKACLHQRSWRLKNRIALDDPRALTQMERLGELTSLTCPGCHGSLWQLREEEFIRFRCRTGHAYTVEALRAEQDQALENILRDALRSAVEKSALARIVTEQARRSDDQESTNERESTLREAEKRVQLIQQVLNHGAK